MELYYYSTEAGLPLLWTNCIKVTAPCDFNDPFEYLPATKGVSEEGRKFCLGFQGASRGVVYTLCLSERKNNCRMWAQYAGNHTGFLLTLDFTKNVLARLQQNGAVKKVDYSSPKRVIVDPKNFGASEMREVLYRKGKDWEHEAEWRIALPSSLLMEINGRYDMLNGHMAGFMPLPDECIVAVTLGHRSSEILFDSVAKIKEVHNSKWKIQKAKLSDDEFSLIEEGGA